MDTSTEEGLLALTEDEKVVKTYTLPLGFRHSKEFLPALKQLLDEESLLPHQLKGVVVGIGPGSYTGIRVGAIIGKMMGFSLRIPIIPLSSLFAFYPCHGEGSFASLLDARIGGYYGIKGVKKGEDVQFLTEPALISEKEIGAYLQDASLIVSPHPLTKLHHPIQKIYPQAEEMAKKGAFLLKTGHYTPDQPFNLLYLRKTQAEIEKML